MEQILEQLGPLRALAGTWEGDSGNDTAPADDRGTEINLYRERMTYVPFGPVDNHEQKLFGLRYSTMAWRKNEADSFHEETGYWLWDRANHQVMRCFIVPRGVTVLAGGTVAPEASEFNLSAELGSPTYGICSNLFLDQEFKTVRYDLKIKVLDPDTFIYDEDTQLIIKGQSQIFHHRDINTMKRVN